MTHKAPNQLSGVAVGESADRDVQSSTAHAGSGHEIPQRSEVVRVTKHPQNTADPAPAEDEPKKKKRRKK